MSKKAEANELAICKRRGHGFALSTAWRQCQWCGTWARELRTTEERMDTPPESEQDPILALRRIAGANKQGKP